LIVFGVMISYWIDLGFSFLEPSTVSWRFPIAFQILLALIIVAVVPGLPESPRWFAKHMTLLLYSEADILQVDLERPGARSTGGNVRIGRAP